MLLCKPVILVQARDFIQRHCGARVPISVHLKNTKRSSGRADWYNAKLDEWKKFFETFRGNEQAMFLLVGNEILPEEFSQFPNVVITKDHGSTLLNDLALISLSFAFFGVASGLCQMALFSKVPYAIFKNPAYHSERMDEELGNRKRFNFSTPLQKFIRRVESEGQITQEFELILNSASRAGWKRRTQLLIAAKTTDGNS